jgi:hypothetical protein
MNHGHATPDVKIDARTKTDEENEYTGAKRKTGLGPVRS